MAFKPERGMKVKDDNQVMLRWEKDARECAFGTINRSRCFFSTERCESEQSRRDPKDHDLCVCEAEGGRKAAGGLKTF